MNNSTAPSTASLESKQPRIAFFIESVDEDYQAGVYRGVEACCREMGLDCVVFSGGSLGSSPLNRFESNRNVLYSQLSAETFAGLIVACSLGNYAAAEQWQGFLNSFAALPMVSLGAIDERIPCVRLDNQSSMRQLVQHLITVHGCRNIGFVKGPEQNAEARQRWQAFSDVCREQQIHIDERFVEEGAFTYQSGKQAARRMLECGVEQLDAVVCASDSMALGVMHVFEKQGIAVPYDIKVTGFDYQIEGQFSIPRLTTVVQPLESLGRSAVKLLLQRIAARDTSPNVVEITPQLCINESCGCVVQQRLVCLPSTTTVGGAERRLVQRELELLLKQEPLVQGAVQRKKFMLLLDSLLVEGSERVELFFEYLDGILRESIRQGLDPYAWQQVLERVGRAYGSGGDQMSYIQQLLLKGQVYVGDIAQRYQGMHHLRAWADAASIRELGYALSTAVTVPQFVKTLDSFLPRFPVDRCVLVLYDKDDQKRSRIFYRYVSATAQAHEQEGATAPWFETSRCLPHWDEGAPGVFVAEALFFRDQSLGYMLLDAPGAPTMLFGALREILGSVLVELQLFETLNEQTEALRAAHEQLLQHREKEQHYLKMIQHELDVARTIQRDFLPNTIPTIAGWESGFLFKPAREVAGDFYDIFTLTPTKVALVLADVCGKSLGAALFMSLIRTLIRALSQQAFSSDEACLQVISFVNEYIQNNHHQQSGPVMYATLFYGVLDHSSGTLSYINAGHQPPMHIGNGRILQQLRPTGPAVGIINGAEFGVGKCTIGVGEMLFAYTDGVNEAQNSERELLGREVVVQELIRPNLSARDAITNIEALISKHIGQEQPWDDITMMTLRRTGQTSEDGNIDTAE